MNIDLYMNVADLKQGYIHNKKDNVFHCLFCRQEYVIGDIYSFGDRLVEASTAIKLHIREVHGSVFDMLIAEDKKNTGLTGVQSEILSCFYYGLPDKEIASKTGTSPSTVRFQRFNLREKARQAKAFLALFELMEEKATDRSTPEIHPGATMVDERYITSEAEAEQIIATYFASTNPPVLKSFPPKEKKKLVILRVIAGLFERGKIYGEREINSVLKPIYGDYATIRRYLIEYGFMERTQNCEQYWLK